MQTELTEDQVEWTVKQIISAKESDYTGDDFSEVPELWDPEKFDMPAERLNFLKDLYDALTAEKKDLGTITG